MSAFSPEHSALRGIGSSCVILAHNTSFFVGVTALPVALAWGLSDLTNVGWMGVALFLSLSIYLLMGSLDTRRDLRRYFFRRMKRIWPLYFGFCAVVFLLIDHDPTHLLFNVTFMATLFPNQAFYFPNPLIPIALNWTIQVEELAYLSFPVIALLSSKNRVVLGWCLVLFSVGYDLYAIRYLGLAGTTYRQPWTWLVCYGFGLLAYEYKRAGFAWSPKMAALACGTPALALVFPSFDWPVGLLLVGPAVMWLLMEPPAFLRRFALVAVGECSYALYLVHAFWLWAFGIVGIPFAYGSAWLVEYAQRGKQMTGRLQSVSRAR